jgi:hypothetical protein
LLLRWTSTPQEAIYCAANLKMQYLSSSRAVVITTHTMWSRQAAVEGNTHIILLPRWTGIVRSARLGIAFVVVGLIGAATAIWVDVPHLSSQSSL